MCGINLIVNCPADTSDDAIRGMMDGTSHRGPDHSHWMKVSPTCYVAANRLKVSGMGPNANQPLVSEDQQYVLVWNGALYNHYDLRNRLLARGVSMRSGSDSEALLQWLMLFGKEGIGALEGMFSLIFIDILQERILIARDLTGQKPLYFLQNGNEWFFSSEIKGILASDRVSGRLDTSQLEPYLYLRHPLPPFTFYQDIRQFPAGQVLELCFDGREMDVFQLSLNHDPLESGQATKFTELLTDSVLKHLHAEVPVGLVLSGGADSTLLYELWYRETGVPLRSYTAVFGARYKELEADGRFAKQVAHSFHGDHHEVMVTPEVFLTYWDAYCKGLDQPIGDSAGFLTWLIAKEASRQVKILVSGAGADELMGGYNRHSAFLAYLNYGSFFVGIKSLSGLPWLPSGYRKFLSGVDRSPARTFMNLAALQTLPDALAEDLKKYWKGDLAGLKEALAYDRSLYLREDVLKIFDHSCMAFGIEGRSPYLDYTLLRFFEGMSESEQRSLIGKRWIKNLLVSLGKQDVANRKKLGFGLPILDWYQTHDGFKRRVLDTLSQFDRDYATYHNPEMRILAQSPERAIKGKTLLVWNLFLLASWIYNHRL